MNRLYLLSISILALGLVAGVSLSGSDDARAARGKVTCKLKGKKGKKRVVCPKRQVRGKHGRRGRRGRAGPAGAPGAPGASGAGSGLTLNFNADLNANEIKQVVIGNFTIRAASGPTGSCVNIQLRAGNIDSRVSIGSKGPFSSLLNNLSTELQIGNTSDMFTAVSDSGGSTVSGIVGRVTVGGRCLVSGYVTGI